jgi:hypothetical protein
MQTATIGPGLELVKIWQMVSTSPHQVPSASASAQPETWCGRCVVPTTWPSGMTSSPLYWRYRCQSRVQPPPSPHVVDLGCALNGVQAPRLAVTARMEAGLSEQRGRHACDCPHQGAAVQLITRIGSSTELPAQFRAVTIAQVRSRPPNQTLSERAVAQPQLHFQRDSALARGPQATRVGRRQALCLDARHKFSRRGARGRSRCRSTGR